MKNSELKQRITLSVKVDETLQGAFSDIAKQLNISKASLLRIMVAEAISCDPKTLAARLFSNQIPSKRGRPKLSKNNKEKHEPSTD